MSDDKTEPIYSDSEAIVLWKASDLEDNPWIELGTAKRVTIDTISRSWEGEVEDEAEVIPLSGVTIFSYTFTFPWPRRASALMRRRASACQMVVLRSVRKRKRRVRRDCH